MHADEKRGIHKKNSPELSCYACTPRDGASFCRHEEGSVAARYRARLPVGQVLYDLGVPFTSQACMGYGAGIVFNKMITHKDVKGERSGVINTRYNKKTSTYQLTTDYCAEFLLVVWEGLREAQWVYNSPPLNNIFTGWTNTADICRKIYKIRRIYSNTNQVVCT